MKQDLLEETCIFLLRNSYTVKSLTQSCFDVLARKEDKILLLKVLEDANAITRETAGEMSKLSSYLKASPLIIAKKAGQPLENNVVYLRFGIVCTSPATFQSSLQDRAPFIVCDHSGLAALVKGAALKERREEQGFSLQELSRKVGVSKMMIQKYEEQRAKVSYQHAVKLYDLFGERIFHRFDVFSCHSVPEISLSSDIGRKYQDLGFKAAETRKVPFDFIAKKDKNIILTEVGDKHHPQLEPLSRMLDAEKLVIYSKKKPRNAPSMTKKEFMEFEKAYELISFLKEY